MWLTISARNYSNCTVTAVVDDALSSSSLKVIQGGDKRATERMGGGIAAGHPPAYSLRVKTVQVVRLEASAEANAVALIKWNWN